MTQQDLPGITFEQFLAERARQDARLQTASGLAPDEENVLLLQLASEIGVKSFPGLGGAQNVEQANEVIRNAIATHQRLQQFPLALERREAATSTPLNSALTGLSVFSATTDPFGELLGQTGAQLGAQQFPNAPTLPVVGNIAAFGGGLLGGALAPTPRLRPPLNAPLRPGPGLFPGVEGAIKTGRGVDNAARQAIRQLPDGAGVRSALDRVSPLGVADAAGPEDVDAFDTTRFPLPTPEEIRNPLSGPGGSPLELEMEAARAGRLAPRPKPRVTPEVTGATGAVSSRTGQVITPENNLFGIRQLADFLGVPKGNAVVNRIRGALPERVREAPGLRRALQTDRDEIIDPLFDVREQIIRNGDSRGTVTASSFGPEYRRIFTPDDKGQLPKLAGIDRTIPGAPTLQDVAARLPTFAPHLTSEELAFLERVRQELAPYRQALEAAGDEFGQRTDIQEGGFYIPRGTALDPDAPVLRQRGSTRPGATPGFERPAAFESQAAGILAGREYPNFEQAIQGHIQRAARRTADLFTQNYLSTVRDATGQKFGKTAKELAMGQNPDLVRRMESLRALRDRLEQLLGNRGKAMQQAITKFLDDPLAQDIDEVTAALSKTQSVARGRLAGTSVDELRGAIRQMRTEIRALKPEYDRALERASRIAGRSSIGKVGEFPQLNGVTFPERMAARANEMILREQERFPRILEDINQVQQLFKAANATLDNSGIGIQALIAAYNDPRAFQRALRVNLKSFATRNAFGDWANDFNANAAARGTLTVQQLADNGVRFLNANEFDVVSSLPEKIPVLGRGVAASNRAFAAISNVVRAEWVDDLVMEEMARGRSLDEIISSGDLQRIANTVNRATGIVDNRFSVANFITFSARFLAARIVTLARAVRGLDIDAPLDVIPFAGRFTRPVDVNPFARLEDKLARRAVLRMIGYGTMLTVALNELQGEDTDFRPFVGRRPNPNFMRVRFANRDFSLFGSWDSTVRLLASIGSGNFKSAARSTATAPLIAMGWDAADNRDYFGNPIFRPQPSKTERARGAESPTFVEHSADFLTFMAESTIPFSADEAPQTVSQLVAAGRSGRMDKLGIGALLALLESGGIKSSALSNSEIEALLKDPELDVETRAELKAEQERRKSGRQQGAFDRTFGIEFAEGSPSRNNNLVPTGGGAGISFR